jgi:hypothetical protein
MDFDIFHNRDIYHKFRNEYWETPYIQYDELIESKNLGIICLDSIKDLYKVIDEKKWALNKIKYGF